MWLFRPLPAGTQAGPGLNMRLAPEPCAGKAPEGRGSAPCDPLRGAAHTQYSCTFDLCPGAWPGMGLNNPAGLMVLTACLTLTSVLQTWCGLSLREHCAGSQQTQGPGQAPATLRVTRSHGPHPPGERDRVDVTLRVPPTQRVPWKLQPARAASSGGPGPPPPSAVLTRPSAPVGPPAPLGLGPAVSDCRFL